MKKKIIKAALILIIFFAFFGLVAGFFIQSGVNDLKKASEAIKNQDLDGSKKSLEKAKKNFEYAKTTMTVFLPVKFVPIIGWYTEDARNGISAAVYGMQAAQTLAEAITPYADILGLKGKGNFMGGTAQERLVKVVEALSKATPQMDEIGKHLTLARQSVDKIQTWRYPNFLPGHPRDKVAALVEGVDQAQNIVVNFQPLLGVLPDILGQNKERKYLVLFQNDKELRPTGGFITAYAIFRVDKGVITSETSEDIYRLDEQLLKKIKAPEPILKYLPNVPNLNLRDSNLSPDYKASMGDFESLYNATITKKNIDGIIALDTHFVVSLVDILGPIEAYGTKFTTQKMDECDCAQILLELEKFADQPVAYEKGDRKDILGVLMQQIMAKAFNGPKENWPKLLRNAMDNLRDKHVLLYFHDAKNQEAVEKINFGGRIYSYDGDYLHINEANFAGAKSNLYVQEKVSQKVTKDKDGNLHKILTIEYKYPRKGDNCSLERKGGLCLAGTYRDWLRIYVPKGSKLIKATGTAQKFEMSEDLQKTVFDSFFELRPEGALKIELEYTVPIKVSGEYKLLIQKQPGNEGHTYVLDAFGKHQRPFALDTDKELLIKL